MAVPYELPVPCTCQYSSAVWPLAGASRQARSVAVCAVPAFRPVTVTRVAVASTLTAAPVTPSVRVRMYRCTASAGAVQLTCRRDDDWYAVDPARPPSIDATVTAAGHV